MLLNLQPKRRPRLWASRIRRSVSWTDFVELQAGGVGGWIDGQFLVAEHVVQQMFQPLFAEHRRIHFDDHVQIALDEQEFADPLDFVGRAAVEGRERERVGKLRWDISRSRASE